MNTPQVRVSSFDSRIVQWSAELYRTESAFRAHRAAAAATAAAVR